MLLVVDSVGRRAYVLFIFLLVFSVHFVLLSL